MYVYDHKHELGQAAGQAAAEILKSTLAAHGQARVIIGTGPSQQETVAALVSESDLDWPRIEVFHMDEYVGMSADHPASFRRWLNEHVVQMVEPKAVHYLDGDADDIEQEMTSYERQLEASPADICLIGFGENGHIAFNDPHVADFQDSRLVKRVSLDERCRMQQVGEGHFPSLEQTPAEAITLTCTALMRARHLICPVPDRRKAQAVRDALQGPLTTDCPASLVFTHEQVAVYLDQASASLLDMESSQTLARS